MTNTKSLYAPGYSGTAPAEFALKIWKSGYNPSGGMPVCLYLHSALGLAQEPLSCYIPPTISYFNFLNQIADQGYLIVAPDMGGFQTFGNDTAMARITDVIAWAKTNDGKGGPIGRSGPVHIIGTSMGGQGALVYALANPAAVKAVCVTSPLLSLLDAVTNNRAGQAAAINAAYGGTYSDTTNGPTKSPVKFAASLTVPGQIWTSTDDTVVPSTFADTVAAAWPGVDYHKSAVGDHGSEQASAWFLANIGPVLNFLDSHK